MGNLKVNGNITTNGNFLGKLDWSYLQNKPSYYDAKSITNITRSGTTFTATYLDGTTFTFSQQDNDTYGRTANTTSKIFLMGGTSQSASNKTTYSNVNCFASGGYLYSNGTKVSTEGHTHSYLPLSGGTLTGVLTVNANIVTAGVLTATQGIITGANIIYNQGNTSAGDDFAMIKFYTGDSNGAGIGIGGGGFAIFGSGESSTNLISNLSLAGGTEQTYITSDNNITFYSNCQTITSKKGMIYDTGGQLYPVPTDSNLGTANNRWYYLYTQNINCSNNLAVTNYVTCGNLETKSSLVCGGMMTIKGGGLELFHSTTPYIDFHYSNDSGDFSARIVCSGADEMRVQGVTSFCCEPDNGASLGRSGKRWSALWSANGTIQTSDKSFKKNISQINDKYIHLFSLLNPVSYQFKGPTHDRVHLGFIAQEVEQAMEQSSLSNLEFGGLCKDIEENGNTIYSLRYSEFIALNTMMIKKLQEEINLLKQLLL